MPRTKKAVAYAQADLDEVMDNPEWTEEEFARARPAREVLPPEFFAGLAELRKAGRPRKAHKKVSVTLRLDPDVVSAFKSDGEGWQTRMNDTLKKAVARRRKTSRAA